MAKIDVNKIFEHVTAYTGGSLGLYNDSSVFLDDSGEWSAVMAKYHVKEKGKEDRAFMGEDDRRIHLNQEVLRPSISREIVASIIAFFQAPAYFFESTNYGELIADERRKCMQARTITSQRLNSLYAKASSLFGIAKFVEMETESFLVAEHGYDFSAIKDTLMGDFRNTPYYKGFEVTQQLYEAARRIGREHRILEASLLLAGKGDNFDARYAEVASMDPIDILLNSNLASRVVPQDIAQANTYLEQMGTTIGRRRQVDELRNSWNLLLHHMRLGGAPVDLLDDATKLYEIFDRYDGTSNTNKINKRHLDTLVDLMSRIETEWIEPQRSGAENIVFHDKW